MKDARNQDPESAKDILGWSVQSRTSFSGCVEIDFLS